MSKSYFSYNFFIYLWIISENSTNVKLKLLQKYFTESIFTDISYLLKKYSIKEILEFFKEIFNVESTVTLQEI